MSTFWRLLGFLKPYRAGALWSLLLAALAMVATVAIPWMTGRAIDGLEAGDKGDLRRWAMLIALAAVLRVSLSVARRLVAGRVSLAIEFDLRNLIYRHLQVLGSYFTWTTNTCPAVAPLTLIVTSPLAMLTVPRLLTVPSAL